MTERLQTRIEEVTSRQLEVAQLVADGRTNPQIASALGITLDGAKYHVSELLGRLGLGRRDEIADWYRTERRGQRMRRFSALFASAPRAFATAASVAGVIAIGALFAIGLSGGLAQDTPAPVSPTPTASPTPPIEPGAAPPVGAVGDASDLPADLQWLPVALGERLRAAPPGVVSWERVDWFNGCFDIDVPRGCPLSVSPVPGYRVVMDLDGAEYVALTALEGERYALEVAPPIPPFEVAFSWAGDTYDYHCNEVRLSLDGRGSIAGCGEPATPFTLNGSVISSPETLAYILSFGPIEGEAPIGVFEVLGGGDPASLSQRKAVQTWAGFLATEAYRGHVVTPPRSLIWSSDNDEACRHLEIMYFGAVEWSDCPVEDAGGYLEPDDLERFHIWWDQYETFEWVGADGTEFIFGFGSTLAPLEVREEIAAWVAALAEDASGPNAGE